MRNRTRCLRNGKRKNSNNAQSSSSSASSTIRYVYKTDFSIALTTLQSSSMILSCIFLHWNKKQTEKHHVLDSNLRSQGHSDSSLSVRLLTLGSDITIFQIDMFLYVRMDVSVKMTKKTTKAPAVHRETTRARSRAVLARSGGASKVKHVQQSAHREAGLISI